MYEFRYGAFLKAFIYIFCPGLIALFIWILLNFRNQDAVVYFAAILPISLGMIALSVYGIVDVTVGKLVITNDQVQLHSPFGLRTLMIDEIRGFRQDESYIRIIPHTKSQKEVKFSNYFKDAKLIVEWLSLHFVNLDSIEGDEEEQQVLNDDELGASQENRLQNLNQARKVTKVLNGGAWIILIWLFAFRQYETPGIILAGLYPIIALFVTLYYRGLVSPDEYENSKMPSVGTALILPGMTLALRSMMDFDILSHPKFLWVAVVAVSVIFSVLYMLPSFRFASRPTRFYVTGLVMIFLNLFYGYGVIIQVNCRLDHSQPDNFNTVVIDKRISKGRTTTYYLDLQPWGTLTETQEAKAKQDQYESIHKGDSIVVTQHAGSLAIPWIEIQF